MAKKNISPFFFILAVLFLLSVPVYAQGLDKNKEAQELMLQAGELVRQGKPDQSLIVLKRATVLSPKDPDIRMNYAMMLFIKGQRIFRLTPDNTKRIFKEAQDELITAIKLYKSQPDKDPMNFSKSQCYFLLGDIYYYVYKNEERAKVLYQGSLKYNPANVGALEALKRLKVYER